MLPACGDEYSDWVIEAKATEGIDGSRHKTCIHDENHITTENIPAIEVGSTYKLNALDYILSAMEVALLTFMSLALISQYKVIKWDKALESRYKKQSLKGKG